MGQVEGRPLEYGFLGDDVTSFGGLLPIIEYAKSFNFFSRIAEIIPDPRSSNRVKHLTETLCSQLTLADIVGCHDYSDHDDLRNDPVFKLLVRSPERLKNGTDAKDLSGKSELQRYIEGFNIEGRTTEEIYQFRKDACRLLTDIFAESHSTAPTSIILDADGTDIEAHGNQEGKEYNSYYKGSILMLQTLYAGGVPLDMRILPGDHHCSYESTEMFAGPLQQLLNLFPKSKITCRGDCGYQKDTTMKMIEEQEDLGYLARYVFALIANPKLKEAVQEDKTRIEDYCQQHQCSKTEYVEFQYRTQQKLVEKTPCCRKTKL